MAPDEESKAAAVHMAVALRLASAVRARGGSFAPLSRTMDVRFGGVLGTAGAQLAACAACAACLTGVAGVAGVVGRQLRKHAGA